VSADRVQIISIQQYAGVSTRGYRAGTGGGHTQIQVRVAGALKLNNIDQSLARHGFPRVTVKTRVSWDHHVSARARPGKSLKMQG
jgi:hypothetical protein